MKFFHISDLHIGKQLHYYNMKEDQRAILKQIVERAEEYRPDAVLICGDIFDKSVPSGEAYTVFDEFLNELADIVPQIPVLMIAGNHDNPQRLSYAKEFLERHGFYLSVLPPQRPEERLKRVELTDEWGKVNFYLLPFTKPGYVRQLFEEGVITDYNSAIRELLAREGLDREHLDMEQADSRDTGETGADSGHTDQAQSESGTRNVLMSHQFYVNGTQQPEGCDSEQHILQVGGLNSVEVSLVEHFDYVALGHIHGAQKVKSPHIRYCGTPLKYSVSEEHHEKSITLVTLGKKGTAPVIETIPLVPLKDVRREKGLLAEVLARATEENCHDYISVTITDEKEPYHPMEQLQEKYDSILELRVDNQRTRIMSELPEAEEFQPDPMEVFRSFYREMRNQPMSPEEEAWMQKVLSREEAADGQQSLSREEGAGEQQIVNQEELL